MLAMQTIPAFYFEREELARLARRAQGFRAARPFPHVVLDDFLPTPVIELLIHEFPGPADIPDLPLRFVRVEGAQREAFAALHLRAVIAAQRASAADFLARYQPVALLGHDAAGTRVVTCVVDANGELYAVAGCDSTELIWVGYLDEVLDSIERARTH